MANIEIRNTSNEVVTTIDSEKGIDNTATSINLFGKGVEEYLTEVNENFYHLLENFANKTAPSNPQEGQIWYAKRGTYRFEARGTGLNKKASRTLQMSKLDANGSVQSTQTFSVKQRRGIALIILTQKFDTAGKPNGDFGYSVGYYDIYGSNAAKTQLARKLGTIEDTQLFVMISYDAIGTNDDLNKRMDKLNTKAWHKIKKSWRYPYAAIGSGKDGIISEDLKDFDEKKHAFAQIAMESVKNSEGMGTHTSLTYSGTNSAGTIPQIQTENDNLLVWDGKTWKSDASTVDGKDLKSLRSFVLSGVDLSVKFDKSGGTVNGSVVLSNTLIPNKDIVPTGNEIQDLGTSTVRYRTLHLSEDKSIYMGPGKEFDKNSFVYTVEKETDSITHVPSGSLILNRATGEAVVKKGNYVQKSTNTTFRKLSEDKKYGVVIGGNNYNFFGDTGIFMGSWRHGKIQKITITTPSNSTDFGSCRTGGHSAGASDGVRGLSFWQHSYSGIQHITIATPMNAVNFGRFYGGWGGAAASNGTRAVTLAGVYYHSTAYYVLFSTPMNAVSYASLGTSAHWNAAVSDGNKAIFDRGAWGWSNNQYRYMSLEQPSNGVYFGKMQNSRGWTGAASNGVHGLWAGGHEGWHGNINYVEKLTLATPSNSTHFGNLSYSRHTSSPVANESRMVAAGGSTYSTTLDYLSFANGGSASKFGNAGTGIRYAAAFSGN